MLQNRQRIIAIEGVPSCGSMLIAMFRDVEGIDYVELNAWHSNLDPNEEPFFQAKRVDFLEDHLAESYIKSYPAEQAFIWTKEFYDKYVNKPKSLTV